MRLFIDRRGFLRDWVVIAGWSMGVILLCVAVVGGVLVGMYHWDIRSCEAQAEGMEREHRYGFWSGCLVESDGVFVPIDNLRVTNEEEQG